MKTIKSIVCIVLSLLMVLSIAACGTEETPSDVPSTDVNNESVVDDATDNPSTDDSGSANTDTSNKQTSLTWKQVKAKLPSNASGKTVEIMEWNAQTPMNKKVCENFTKQTGIEVVYTTEGYSSYMAKIAGRVATGNPPTVARLRDNVPEYMIAMQPI